MSEKTNTLIEAFLWRFLNTLKVSVFPVVLGVLLTELQNTGDLSCLSDPKTWMKVGYAGVVALLIATGAGLDKVQRENVRLEE